ncbi:putative MATE family efflux protein [Jatrophihabitans sp. GAS493]|uniref:MATE family efflux transporter n=1 Tax=Jatrophihabitans sp. GAS493 TaxID=1907575 RepID=UPI000BB863C9|nr:MATE family efflux transporter [Jatrophihabitans sp. GAS493]SOD74163.1 putative MATE family efflux protein [Jatrophihabitans sp. GAS493]
MSGSEAATGVSTRRLLSLSASAFVVLAAEPLYLLVDTSVVGHLGSEQLAALGIGGALMGLALLLGMFVEYGTTARAARWFGAGDRAAAVNEGVQASWLAIIIGCGAVVVGELLAHPAVLLLAGSRHDAAVADAAESWFRIAVLGLPGVLLVLAGNGWMRGVQETRQPVRIVLIANAVSAILCPILVYPVGLGLRGSAIANVTAQVIGALLFLRALRSSAASTRPEWRVMRLQTALGRDLLVRSIGFQIAFLSAAAVAARMGTAQIAAHQIGLQLWEFSALVLDSFAIAAQSLVGAALGASAAALARRTAWQVGRYGLIAGCGFAALMAAGWFAIPALFTTDPAVLHQVHLLWPWFVGMLPAAGLVFALDGVLIGAGDVGFMRTLTLIAAVGFFTPLALASLRWNWGIGGVWFGLTMFILVRLVGMLLRVRTDRWLITGTGEPA